MRNLPSGEDVSIDSYALKAREATADSFDRKNKTHLEETLQQLDRILRIKILIFTSTDFDFSAGSRLEAFALTKSALDVLVSALHMARQRRMAELFSLLRVALEASGTALHITRNQEAYEAYLDHKYRSTTAISFAKAEIPIFGEIWGALSTAAVHITQRAYGPRLEEGDQGELIPTIEFSFHARGQEPIQDRLALSFISLIANIVLKIMELTFFEDSGFKEGWLQLSGTRTEYWSNTDKQIAEFYDRVTTVTQ